MKRTPTIEVVRVDTVLGGLDEEGQSVAYDWRVAPEHDDPEAHLMRQPMGLAWEERTNTLYVSDFKVWTTSTLTFNTFHTRRPALVRVYTCAPTAANPNPIPNLNSVQGSRIRALGLVRGDFELSGSEFGDASTVATGAAEA